MSSIMIVFRGLLDHIENRINDFNNRLISESLVLTMTRVTTVTHSVQTTCSQLKEYTTSVGISDTITSEGVEQLTSDKGFTMSLSYILNGMGLHFNFLLSILILVLLVSTVLFFSLEYFSIEEEQTPDNESNKSLEDDTMDRTSYYYDHSWTSILNPLHLDFTDSWKSNNPKLESGFDTGYVDQWMNEEVSTNKNEHQNQNLFSSNELISPTTNFSESPLMWHMNSNENINMNKDKNELTWEDFKYSKPISSSHIVLENEQDYSAGTNFNPLDIDDSLFISHIPVPHSETPQKMLTDENGVEKSISLEDDVKNNSIKFDPDQEKQVKKRLQDMIGCYNQSYTYAFSMKPSWRTNELELPRLSPQPKSDNDLSHPFGEMHLGPEQTSNSVVESYSPVSMSPSVRAIVTTASKLSPEEYFGINPETKELYWDDLLNMLLQESDNHSYLNNKIDNLVKIGKEDKIRFVRLLRLLVSQDYEGNEKSIKETTIQSINIIQSKLLILMNMLYEEEEAEARSELMLLVRDIISYSGDKDIAAKDYIYCVKMCTKLLDSEFTQDVKQTISSSLVILVSALNASDFIKLYLPFWADTLTSNSYGLEAKRHALQYFKYYICFNKSNIIHDFTFNPTLNKIDCCGYKIIGAYKSNLSNLVNTQDQGILDEIIEIYLIFVELLLNNQEIPIQIRYEILTNYISSSYTTLESMLKPCRRTIELPKLPELGFDSKR